MSDNFTACYPVLRNAAFELRRCENPSIAVGDVVELRSPDGSEVFAEVTMCLPDDQYIGRIDEILMEDFNGLNHVVFTSHNVFDILLQLDVKEVGHD